MGARSMSERKPLLEPLEEGGRTTVVQVLECTLDILSDKSRWAKGVFNRTVRVITEDGKRRYAPGQFCLVGAAMFCIGRDERGELRNPALLYRVNNAISRAITSFLHTEYAPSIAAFNDDHTRKHEDILAVLREALSIAKATNAEAPTEETHQS